MKKMERKKIHEQIFSGTCGTISKGLTWVIFVPEFGAGKMFGERVAEDFSEMVTCTEL